MELDIETTDRLLNAILFCLGPYIENENFRDEYPWFFELAESYNEIVSQLPEQGKLYHHQIIQF